MMINIYDTINKLQSELVETAQYKTLRDAFTAVQADAAATEVFSRFQVAQADINQTMQAGQEPNEEQIKNWQAVATQMDAIEPLKNLMQAEQALNALLVEINDIVTKPIADLYAAK
ncbi:hypothetical protein WOSG25_030940 [Weissella oryzae SG25]|uniref:UPF0342 protein WOSG25_030940 n=1 Tax=Weissella oryzae (strain DSM 25784 / JCM 18191 / LMG 30913 / SG25) TaxID=1329250 RepID=A0A069CSW6_WEIOS|nr:YlbF family regulator [Weissella oryzae]GAK30497.1 hypothetical protein WOSG25_030940 [Weissella oryzae SG25]